MSSKLLGLLLTVLLLNIVVHAQTIVDEQQETLPSTASVPGKYFEKVSGRARSIEQNLDKKSVKALKQFQKQEKKIQEKLAKLDPAKAQQVFSDANLQYEQLQNKLTKVNSLRQYIPSLDSLGTSIKFLQQNPQFLSNGKQAGDKLKNASSKLNGLQDRFQKAEEIKKFLKERRQYLKDQLSQLGFAKEFKHLNKQFYYYSQQLTEYKELLKDHTKAEKKALELLSKTKLFRDFMQKNSQLASMFRMPGDPNDPSSQASLAGLQTRAQVTGLIQQQLGAGGAGAQAQFQQNLQQAQNELNQLKNKVSQLGGSSSEDILPEGFKPNNQKTKSFLQRLELGTNLQSQKANGYFPTTSDLGLSLGYKLNDTSILGIGASYKMGWGRNIRNINITHQGVGMRSFVDWKIKGSLWLSGGYEMNYRNEFNRVEVLRELDAWQQSGLVGVSKVVSLKTKFFKNTKIQLLWDFLSYQQVPRAQPVVFRVGYNIK
jgi:hypothetical protein